jgi:hypothetical protein
MNMLLSLPVIFSGHPAADRIVIGIARYGFYADRPSGVT